MWLSDSYDVPQQLVDDPPSSAFRQYLLNWFGSNRVSFHERLTSANKLAPEEIVVARQLIRANLKCRHDHITSGTWALDDLEAVPVLREMLDTESSESRRLVISGALWKLNKDPVFIECLNQAKKSGLFWVAFHVEQIRWLNDERSIDLLIDLLPPEEQVWRESRLLRLRDLFWMSESRRREHKNARMAGGWARCDLHLLEFGRSAARRNDLRPPSYYRERRNDPAFREMMLQSVHKSILLIHQGH